MMVESRLRHPGGREDAMDKTPKSPFEIPAEMIALAEQSFEQARRAFDQFVNAAHSTMNAFEEQARTSQAGGKEIAGKIMSFAEQNVASAFAYAEQLVHAKDPQALLQLHNDYVQSQMRVLGEQAKAVAEAASKAAMDTTRRK
jgi:phasin